MKRFWFYCFYTYFIFFNKLHRGFNKINPALLLFNTRWAKKKFESRGIIDPHKEFDKTYEDPINGISIRWAEGLLCGLLFLILFNAYLTVNSLFLVYTKDLGTIVIIFCGALSLVFNSIIVFRNNIYLDHFRDFQKIEGKRRKVYSVLVLVITLTTLVYFFMIFNFLTLLNPTITQTQFVP